MQITAEMLDFLAKQERSNFQDDTKKLLIGYIKGLHLSKEDENYALSYVNNISKRMSEKGVIATYQEYIPYQENDIVLKMILFVVNHK